MTDAIIEKFKRIANTQPSTLSSEEDVKISVVLPLLQALGYESSDLNFEGRTGKGYVDVTVDQLPTAIVVETKSPRTRLDNYVEQLELYVFNKHHHDRVATVAILTDGDFFRVYGLTEALRKGSLATHLIFSFRRAELATPALAVKLSKLLSKQSNQSGVISGVITRYQQEQGVKEERSRAIHSQIATLMAERNRINSQLGELDEELNTLFPSVAPTPEVRSPRIGEVDANYSHPSSPEILRLLKECNATSRQTAKTSKWLAEQLVGKEGIRTREAVSFGIIELRDTYGELADEKTGKDRWVWLKRVKSGNA